MKWCRYLVTGLTLSALACGGGESPGSASEEAPPPPEGVYGHAPAPSQGLPSVVLLEPVDGAAAPPPSEPALMDQLGLVFLPRALMVQLGQPVEFANSESLAHNVHLHLIANDSSVYYADMDPDSRTQLLLEQEGAYDVTCDEHPGMTAMIYVTSTPYAAFAEQDGSFVITDVPPGSYTARVWNASTELRGELRVDVTDSSTELDLTAFP